MTTRNRPNTALLVIDVQNGVVEGTHERDAVVANVGSLVEQARRGIPVVWVIQHSSEQLARGSESGASASVTRLTPSRSSRRPTATPSRTRLSRPCCRISESGDSSSSAHRPTSASARRSTGRSSGATTRPSSATPTRRRIRRVGRPAAGSGHRAHEPLLDVPAGAGAGRPGRSRPRPLTSAARPKGPTLATAERQARDPGAGAPSADRERCPLELEQRALDVQSARVPGQRAVRADDAVAREHDRDRVAVHDHAHGARRARAADLRREAAVRVELPVRNARELVQHSLVERGHSKVFIQDLCCTPRFEGCQVCFMDINKSRLDTAVRFCEQYSNELGFKIDLQATDDRKECIKNADFVVDLALILGHDGYRKGWEIAAQNGYRYGGSQHIMHDEAFWINFYQLKHFEDVAEDMLDLSPNAWLLLLANPVMAATTHLSRKYKNLKFAGLCHGYAGVYDVIKTLNLEKARRTAPSAPNASTSASGLVVSWNPPAAGAPVTGYVVTCVQGTTSQHVSVDANTFTATIVGLNGTMRIDCTIVATSTDGSGTAASLTFTPATTNHTPTAVLDLVNTTDGSPGVPVFSSDDSRLDGPVTITQGDGDLGLLEFDAGRSNDLDGPSDIVSHTTTLTGPLGSTARTQQTFTSTTGTLKMSGSQHAANHLVGDARRGRRRWSDEHGLGRGHSATDSTRGHEPTTHGDPDGDEGQRQLGRSWSTSIPG